MRPDVRRFIERHSLPEREVVRRDIEPYMGRDLVQLGLDVTAVCEAAAAIIAASPDRERLLASQDPPHPSYRAIIARLRAGPRGPGGG